MQPAAASASKPTVVFPASSSGWWRCRGRGLDGAVMKPRRHRRLPCGLNAASAPRTYNVPSSDPAPQRGLRPFFHGLQSTSRDTATVRVDATQLLSESIMAAVRPICPPSFRSPRHLNLCASPYRAEAADIVGEPPHRPNLISRRQTLPSPITNCGAAPTRDTSDRHAGPAANLRPANGRRHGAGRDRLRSQPLRAHRSMPQIVGGDKPAVRSNRCRRPFRTRALEGQGLIPGRPEHTL